MKKERFQELLKQQFNTLADLTATKGIEYARSDDDQLANFKRQATELGIEPRQVLAVFLNKHIDAVKSYIKTGQVLSEPVEGRIDDCLLYLILLKAMIFEGRYDQPVETGRGNCTNLPRADEKAFWDIPDKVLALTSIGEMLKPKIMVEEPYQIVNPAMVKVKKTLEDAYDDPAPVISMGSIENLKNKIKKAEPFGLGKHDHGRDLN